LSSKTPAIALRDIVEAIGWIETFTAGMDLDGFREDHRTIAAVERKLLVISEAAIRLGDEADILCPDQPWPSIRGTGNWLRHAYDRIDIETVCAPSQTIFRLSKRRRWRPWSLSLPK